MQRTTEQPPPPSAFTVDEVDGPNTAGQAWLLTRVQILRESLLARKRQLDTIGRSNPHRVPNAVAEEWIAHDRLILAITHWLEVTHYDGKR